MKFELILIVIYLAIHVAATDQDENCVDYYWRDYYDIIPDDAIPAGNDSKGNVLYVGQVYIASYELLPATIIPKEAIALTSAQGKVFRADTYMKILCSPHKEAFEWISIESTDLPKYYDRNLIVGGSESHQNLYVGRVFRDNTAIVGKVYRHEHSSKGIWYPSGKTHAHDLRYEVLLYNCDKIMFGLDLRMGNLEWTP